MNDITRKTSRTKLKPRREPYWLRLGPGSALGFRAGPNTWIAKHRGRDGKRHYKPLTGAVEYDEAKAAAEEWLAQLSGSAVRSFKRDSVKEALKKYLTDLRRRGRNDAADEAEGRFKLCVYADPLASQSLESATREDFEEWRDRLRIDKTGKPRLPRTINRNVRSVIAGLNVARGLGHVGNPDAWALKPLQDDREDDGDTAVFLDPPQRAALIAAAPERLAQFLRGLELTGCRPGELAATTAGDFDGKQLRVAHRKGRPPKLRVRFVVLDAAGVDFFKEQSRNKLPSAPLFTWDGEDPWYNNSWAKALRKARTEANKTLTGKARIPTDATAYSFRHARISELLQLHGIDPLTVAHQTGTSVAIIEKSYLRFIPSAMAEKLAKVKAQ